MAVRRLNHAVLYVNGLAREVEFYTRTLGFEVRMEIPGRAAFLRSPDSVNDHDLGLSKSLYAKDPSGIEFEVLWRVPVEDWDAELAADGGNTVPLDWDRTLSRWDPEQHT